MKKYDLYRDENDPNDLLVHDLSDRDRGYWVKIFTTVYNPETEQDKGFKWRPFLNQYPLVQREITMEQIQRIAEYL